MAWSHVDAVEWGSFPQADRAYLPHACMHCDNAPCVKVCPSGASIQRADGIVTVDYDQCIGCGACLMVCPYDARTIDFNGSWNFGAEAPAPYEAYGTPHTEVAEKCIFCAQRVDAGGTPYCVEACPNAARLFGDVDDPASEVHAYIEVNGAQHVDGTALYYVTGPRDFSVREALMTNVSDIPSQSMSREQEQPAGEQQGLNVGALGAGAVAVAAVAAGAGFAAGSSHGKKRAQMHKEGE